MVGSVQMVVLCCNGILCLSQFHNVSPTGKNMFLKEKLKVQGNFALLLVLSVNIFWDQCVFKVAIIVKSVYFEAVFKE